MFYDVNNKIIQLYNYPCVAPFENFCQQEVKLI